MKNETISIIVPVFNEAESLVELVKNIERAFVQYKREIIFIDDGSKDSSLQVLRQIQKSTKTPIMVLQFQKNHGKSAALSEGFFHASGSTLVTMDADLQDDANEASRLIDNLSTDVDMVIGWRKQRNDQSGKRFVSGFFNTVVSKFFGIQLHDMNCGLKVMKKEVVQDLPLYGELHRFLPVLANQRGFRVIEIPIQHHPRKYGSSKYGIERLFAGFDLVTTMFLSGFGTRPLRVFGPVGVVLILSGLFMLIYLTSIWVMGESIGTRPLLLLGVMFVLFGFQLFSTGLLGELIISVNSNKVRPLVRRIYKNI